MLLRLIALDIEWKNSYPPDYGNFYAKKIPQAWTDALDAAIAAGKIPNIPVAVNSSVTGEPGYGTGTNPAQPDICSASAHCKIDGDIWDAPDGIIGIGFDDGPLPVRHCLFLMLLSSNADYDLVGFGCIIHLFAKE